MPAKQQHITKPQGFLAAGVACGIKKSGRNDMAIIAGQADVACAMLTTTNQVVGAPVIYSRKLLPKGYGFVRAIVINAGNANVCTGKVGLANAAAMAKQTARCLGTKADKILVASTGIIGHQLPMEKVRSGIDAAAAMLGTDQDMEALHAIMTTDLHEKYAVATIKIGGKTVTLAGMAKGSGMIAPSLATMISVLTTDAAVAPAALYKALKTASGRTFNALTVDSDTSTSDTLVLMASGQAGNKTLTATGADYPAFAAAVYRLCDQLARRVARDGEGATKLIEITVRGAASDADAMIAAKSVANSPLLKCAAHGGDPNWGRIAAALGKSPARVVPEKLSIRLGGTLVFRRGMGANFDVKKAAEHMSGDPVIIDADLGLGNGVFTAVTCDFSREYIAINADYHT
ncbi:MAG: bifunctional glutamate N-acetyltransferase/amino-acid acetyltransferase ArgJ [Planctomycetaceae bacterium]|nr:bifunctional glutamate N-acetyltransferase/amino-acid acetyltransferase ArgJ [Planctomycetaceae bacterium]